MFNEKERKIEEYIANICKNDAEEAAETCPLEIAIDAAVDCALDEHNDIDEVLDFLSKKPNMGFQEMMTFICKNLPELEVLDDEEYFKLYGKYAVEDDEEQ